MQERDPDYIWSPVGASAWTRLNRFEAMSRTNRMSLMDRESCVMSASANCGCS
jgi:hypothetical protein